MFAILFLKQQVGIHHKIVLREGGVHEKSLLVEKHVSPNVRMDWNELFGVPALWFACNTDKSADYKIVKLLIQHGANPLCQVGDRDHDFVSLDFKYEDTPLSYAVHSGNIKLATTLINESRKKGYDIVNALINEDFTALTVATESLNLDMVQLLIDNHANPNLGEETPLAWLQRSGFILIPLRYKLEEGKKIIDPLLDSGAEINIYDEDGRSALHALNDAIENRLDPEGELVKQVKEFRDYLVQKGF